MIFLRKAIFENLSLKTVFLLLKNLKIAILIKAVNFKIKI